MNALISFTFQDSTVRYEADVAGLPWFNASDVCGALGYVNPRKAIADHVDSEDVTKRDVLSAGGKQRANFVNESGLYALTFGSKLESAKSFKRHITSEVLPSIRRTGSYSAPQLPHTISPAQQRAIQEAVAARAASVSPKERASVYPALYSALKSRFSIAKYDQLPQVRFNDALALIATVPYPVPDPIPAIERTGIAPPPPAPDIDTEFKIALSKAKFMLTLDPFEGGDGLRIFRLADSATFIDVKNRNDLHRLVFHPNALPNLSYLISLAAARIDGAQRHAEGRASQ